MSIFSYTSTQGITKKTPGPLAPPVSSLPSRKMTALSYSWELNMIPVVWGIYHTVLLKRFHLKWLCCVVYHRIPVVREPGMLILFIWPGPPWPRRRGRGGAWRWWGPGRRRWGPWRTPPGPPRTLHTRGTATVYWTLLPRLTEGVLAVTIVVVRLQRCRASHLYFSTRAALNR